MTFKHALKPHEAYVIDYLFKTHFLGSELRHNYKMLTNSLNIEHYVTHEVGIFITNLKVGYTVHIDVSNCGYDNHKIFDRGYTKEIEKYFIANMPRILKIMSSNLDGKQYGGIKISNDELGRLRGVLRVLTNSEIPLKLNVDSLATQRLISHFCMEDTNLFIKQVINDK